MEKCPEEMEFCNNFIEKGLIDKLHKLVNSKFVRIDHIEAIDILKKADKEKKDRTKFFRGGNLCLGYSGSQYFAIDQ